MGLGASIRVHPALILTGAMPPGRARIWLRFTSAEIYRLVPLLNLYGVVYRNRYTPDAITTSCVVCARLSFPSRWEHLTELFGQSKSWLSTVFNDVILYLVARYREVLLWCPLLTYERLQLYEEAIYQVNGVPGVWGASSIAAVEVIVVLLAMKPSGGSTLAIKRPTDTTFRSLWLQMDSQSQSQDPRLALLMTRACINALVLKMLLELLWKAIRLSIYTGI